MKKERGEKLLVLLRLFSFWLFGFQFQIKIATKKPIGKPSFPEYRNMKLSEFNARLEFFQEIKESEGVESQII